MKREATSDVALFEELSHVGKGELPANEPFMEDFAQLVLAESEGYDFCMIPNLFHVGGGKNGTWQVDDVMMIQTTLTVLPKDKRGKIHNNDFIGNRLDPKDWDSDYTIKQVGDKVIWQTKKMEFVAHPPYWEIRGDHMGVQYELVFGGIGNAIRSVGPWEDLPTTLRAGFDHRCWVEGAITVNGRKYNLENGYGVHERFSFGSTYDPVTTMLNPYYWVVGMSESTDIYFFVFPGEEGIGQGQIFLNGETISFGMGQITIEELEWWVDPMTTMYVPTQWKVRVNSPDGTAELDIAAGGHCLYTFAHKTGWTVRCGFPSQISGHASLSNGRSFQFKDVMTYLERGKTTLPLPAGV